MPTTRRFPYIPQSLPRGSDAAECAETLRGGRAGELTDLHLLSLVLSPGSPGRGVRAAEKVLSSGEWPSPSQGRDAPWWRLLSQSQGLRFAAAIELARRLSDGAERLPLIRGPEDVALAAAEISTAQREHFLALYLNTRNRILGKETISVGSLNASIVHPREVFEPALRYRAAALIVVHNHPSGETDPSDDDLAVTRRLIEAGELMGIAVLDHIIVGSRGYTSLKETGHI